MTSTAVSFRYKGLSDSGVIVRGRMEAASEEDLCHRLMSRGLHLIKAQQGSSFNTGIAVGLFAGKVPPRDLILFSLHLAQLIGAGVSLLDSLVEAEAMAGSKRLRGIVARLRHAMEHGALLSQAMAQHPRLFDKIYVGLIETGEVSGDLTKPLQHIIAHLKWREQFSRQVRQALRYPLFALATSLASLVALLVIVVPQLSIFLATLGDELPWQTRLLLGLSSALAHHWQELLLAVAAMAGLCIVAWTASATIRLLTDRAIIRLPFLGAVVSKTALSRFSHFTALLFDNGVGLLACLHTTERLLGNRYLAAALRATSARVEAGWPLSAALAETRAFPRLFLHLVKVGEQSNSLAHSFETIRDFYDRDAEDALERLTSSLQPTFVILVGALLLWIVTAILGPVYSSFSHLPL